MDWKTWVASRNWGMTLGLTKELTSIFRIPACDTALMIATLVFVGTKVFSIWRPSRGPTSTTVIFAGSVIALHQAALPTVS